MKDISPAKGFQIHAVVFVGAVVVNTVINIMTGPPWWAIWVFFPWVVGLGIHWYFTRRA